MNAQLNSLNSQVNLVIPGPEQPLVDGIEGAFRQGELTLKSFRNFPY